MGTQSGGDLGAWSAHQQRAAPGAMGADNTAFSTRTVRKVSLVLAFAPLLRAFVESRALPSAPKRSRCALSDAFRLCSSESRIFEDHRLHDPQRASLSSGCRPSGPGSRRAVPQGRRAVIDFERLRDAPQAFPAGPPGNRQRSPGSALEQMRCRSDLSHLERARARSFPSVRHSTMTRFSSPSVGSDRIRGFGQQQPGHDACARERLAVLPGADAERRQRRVGMPADQPRPDQQGLPESAGRSRPVTTCCCPPRSRPRQHLVRARSGLSSCQRTIRTDAPAMRRTELDRVRDGTRSPFDAARVRTCRAVALAQKSARSGNDTRSVPHSGSAMSRAIDQP